MEQFLLKAGPASADHDGSMLPLPRTPRTLLAPTAGLLLLLGTTACGADQLGERAAESAVERAAEAAASEGVDVDIDTDGGGVTVETSEGTFTSGVGSLPEGFPEDIPIAEGEIFSGASSTTEGQQGWLVTVSVDQAPDEALAEAGAALEAAGYSPGDNSIAMEGLSFVQYVGSEWDLILGATEDGEGGTLLSYTVTQAQG